MLILTVSGTPGDDIRDVAGEMQALADKLGLYVEMKFNGVPCVARPGGSAATLLESWELARNAKHGVAFS